MVRKYIGNVLLAAIFTVLIIFISSDYREDHQSARVTASGLGKETLTEARSGGTDGGSSIDGSFNDGSLNGGSSNDGSFSDGWEMETVFRVFLKKASGKFLSGYEVDESFLSWLCGRYGNEAVITLASYAAEGGNDPEYWYSVTGNSLHALWMEYCKDLQYETWRLSDVVWQECSSSDTTVLDFIGDINFDENWYTTQAMNEKSGGLKSCIAEEVQKELQSADITLVNNEFTYSDRGAPLAGKAYTFRADPERVEQLSVFGADIVSLGNNHVYDYGKDALLDTMKTLDDAGIPYIGAGKNIDEAQKISYFIANGRKIAFVSATQIEKFYSYTKEATEDEPGVLKTLDPARFLKVIEEAKKSSDYVIVYVHWGTEGMLYPQEDMRQLAQSFVQAGADAVIGNHSHRLQGVEYIDGVPVFYGLGNFWFSTGALYTTIVQIRIHSDGTLSFAMLPCIQQELTTRILTEDGEKAEFCRYIADLSVNAAIEENGSLMELTPENAFSETEGAWYLSGSDYASRSGAYDLTGARIDIVGNRE